MNKNALLFLLLCAFLTVIGMAGGWYAAHKKLGSRAPAGPGALETAPDPAHAANSLVRLSPQALENLGVLVAKAEHTTFVKFQEIPAVITETQATYQPVFAPVGGRIQKIRAEFGALVKGNEVILTLIRDAMPRPRLVLTEEVLKPATEELHHTIARLRTSVRGLEILQTEMERISRFKSTEEEGLPILPAKDLIQLRYDLSRARQELENVREQLHLHGFSEEEIGQIEGGKEARISQRFWHDALIRNGLWPPLAEVIYRALPEEMRDLPWTVATISELVAVDLAGRDLAEWLEGETGAARHFISIGGLLQAGSSLEEVKVLYALGALEPVVEIRAPASAPDWDVNKVFIKPGEQVVAGQQLLTLANPRQMFLRVESVGGETAALLSALKGNTELEAAPLVADTGPRLTGLGILNLVNEEASEGTVAYIPVANEPFKVVQGPGDKAFRSWKLRDRLRYMLRIPVEREKMTDVFVLPGDAVTDHGPDKVVFIQDGDGFKPVKVVLLYLDQDVAVLSGNSELFPGDRVVQHGAFGLGLALQAAPSQGADPHAGHGH